MTTLQNVLENVHNLTESNANEIFEDIAKQLFRGFCIKQGCVEYRFLEVEFYYFSLEHKDVLEFGNRPFVYARNCKVPGTFFDENIANIQIKRFELVCHVGLRLSVSDVNPSYF